MPKLRKIIPDIQLHIAGGKMPNKAIELNGKNGIVIERAASDGQLNELYRLCRMTAVLLRYGESMYHGLPLVTISCGTMGREM